MIQLLSMYYFLHKPESGRCRWLPQAKVRRLNPRDIRISVLHLLDRCEVQPDCQLEDCHFISSPGLVDSVPSLAMFGLP